MCHDTGEEAHVSTQRGAPRFSIRITDTERAHLHALAKQLDVSLSDALRTGGRIYLETLATTRDQARMGRRPAAQPDNKKPPGKAASGRSTN